MTLFWIVVAALFLATWVLFYWLLAPAFKFKKSFKNRAILSAISLGLAVVIVGLYSQLSDLSTMMAFQTKDLKKLAEKEIIQIEEVLAHDPENLDLKLKVVSAHAFIHDGKLESLDQERLTEILKANPKHKLALQLKAVNAYQQGQYKEAISLWEELKILNTDDHKQLKLFDDAITKAKSHLSKNDND